MTKKRTGVPPMRGVGAFLSTPVDSANEATTEPTNTISIKDISLPAKQPRRFFDSQKLEDLAVSIRQYGILEPILVRPLLNGKYELVAGERRYRAAQLAGLEEVPIVLRELSDQEALQLALVENLQREDLNPVEETEGLLELLTLNLQCSQEEIQDALTQMATAQKKGTELSGNVSRRVELIAEILKSTVGLTPESFRTARLPLLNLPSDVLEVLRQGKLEYTKARVIARVKDDQKRKALLKDAIAKNLSLSQIKDRIAADQVAGNEEQPETMKQQFNDVYKQVQKSKVFDDPKKQRKLEKILSELRSLLSE